MLSLPALVLMRRRGIRGPTCAHRSFANNLALMPGNEAEQTIDGDYENIGYHNFKAVGYDRWMSWKAGKGRVDIGERILTPQKTDEDKLNQLLPAGWSAVVDTMAFRLARTN
jgi:hypothetical protein